MKKNTKRIIAGLSLLTVLAIAIGVSSGAFNTLDNFVWDINTGTYGASEQGHYFDITTSPTTFSVWVGDGGGEYTPPPKTTTTTTIDSWKASVNFGTILIYPPSGSGGAFGTGSWGAPGFTGMRFTISPATPILQNGEPTADGNPSVAYTYLDTTVTPNRVWKQYYFSYQVMMATNSHDGNAVPADAQVFVGTNLQNTWQNSSYQSMFGGAQIVAVETSTTTSEDAKYLSGTKMPGTSDVGPRLNPYQAAGSLSAISLGSSDIGNTWYIMQLGGFLTPGVGYTYFGTLPTGVSFYIEVFIRYTVHFSVLCSEPPVVNNANALVSTLDNYADKHGQSGDLLDFSGILGFVKLVVIAAVVLIGLYLAVKFRRKTIFFKKA